MPAKALHRRTAKVSTSVKECASGDHAAHHRRTRAARSTEVTHDYVEAIADLIDAGREARVVDVARRLGVTHVTVNRTIARLQKQGLVISEPYRSIFLTEEGQTLAEQVRYRHRVVLDFLLTLGVREETARTDAEGIEHHVSEETLKAFERAARRMKRK